jgi:hypothetical protein
MKNRGKKVKSELPNPTSSKQAGPTEPGRRAFLQKAGISAATIATVGATGLPAFGRADKTAAAQDSFEPTAVGALTGQTRANRARKIRIHGAEAERAVPIPAHPSNRDEALYPSRFANFSKGLAHDPTGEVEPAAYDALLAAIASGENADFDALVTNGFFGSTNQATRRRLANPQAAYAYDMEGTDSHQFAEPPAPAFASAQEAGEMVELYWMALLRDVNFQDYATNPLAQAAATDLSALSDFQGPTVSGQVTPQTLFRDTFPDCTDGPYISQFLLQPANFGAQQVNQQIKTNAPNQDFVTTFQEWLNVENGINPSQTVTPANEVFCINGRSISAYVHSDVLFQAYFVGLLVLIAGLYPLDAGNPYGTFFDPTGNGKPLPVETTGSISQVGFGTFGGPAIAALTCEAGTRALKAQWFQKWMVHRRLRPEEFGGKVEAQRLGLHTYPFHPDLTNSAALGQVFSKFGSNLLPSAFPEGCPMHTSYGSGHATVAGASITLLKAFFDETAVINNPVVASDDGQSLLPYQGSPLTVAGELNKLASNIAQGRNIAGVHWRTDATEAIQLGEAVAISILTDFRSCYNEPFNGFTLTKVDGTTITV